MLLNNSCIIDQYVDYVRSNFNGAYYTSHQKLYRHTAPWTSTAQKLWRGPHYLWLTQSGFPKGQSGQVKRRLWWCQRKEEQGQLEKGRPDDRPGQARPGRTHTHTFSHWQRLSRESNIQCMPPFTTPQSHNGKKTNWICFTYFCSVVLIGCRSWAIMLTMWRVYLMHMLLWLGPSCVCVSKQLDMVLFQQLLCCPLCGFETDIIVWMNMK